MVPAIICRRGDQPVNPSRWIFLGLFFAFQIGLLHKQLDLTYSHARTTDELREPLQAKKTEATELVAEKEDLQKRLQTEEKKASNPQAQTINTTSVEEQKNYEIICKTDPPMCFRVIVLKKRKVTFCSAEKVVSTTSRDYFYNISDGEVVILPNAKYGVHNANWTRLVFVDEDERIQLLTSTQWTHIFIVRNVLERFVSGYLDKIAGDCKKAKRHHPDLAHSFYIKYGFQCNKHADLESFVYFMEKVPRMEGHFAPQASLCGFSGDNYNYPVTDIIHADHTLNDSLGNLSKKLQIDHPSENKNTSSHSTGAKKKMKDLFFGRRELISRIMKLFKQDCKILPKLCDNEDLYSSL